MGRSDHMPIERKAPLNDFHDRAFVVDDSLDLVKGHVAFGIKDFARGPKTNDT